jgi:hypothetical protein
VDDDKWHDLKKYSWRFEKRDYPITDIRGKTIYMHVYLTKPPDGSVIKHINKNKLDNRLDNFEIINLNQFK